MHYTNNLKLQTKYSLKKTFGSYYLFYIIAALPVVVKEFLMSKKQLFTLEFPVRCSPAILWDFLSTPSGLQEWFADKVDEWEGIYSFTWSGGTPERAEILDQAEERFIKYRWMHGDKKEYFEFSIEKTEISNHTVLVVRDFAEKADIKDQTQLWHYQIKELFHRLGA